MFRRTSILTGTLFLLFASSAQSAMIGPDSFGYTINDENTYSFNDISSTGTLSLAGADDSVASAPLGFSFNFYGTSYSTVYWNSNGLITFGVGDASFTNRDLLTTPTGANAPSIAVLWDDWQNFQPGTEGVYYQTVGTPGNRSFVVQWHETQGFLSSPSNVTFQAELNESDHSIHLNYADVSSESFRDNGASSTIGIRNVDGEITGEALQWSYNQASVSNETSLRIYAERSSNLPDTVHTPEPGTIALFGIGLFLGFSKRKQFKKA